MSNLYQAFAEEYLFWIIVGSAAVMSLGQYLKSRSWGQSLSVFVLGMVISWVVVSIPTVKDLVGRILAWIFALITIG